MIIAENHRICLTAFTIFILLSLFSIPVFAFHVDQTNIENTTKQLTQYNRIIGIEDDKAAFYVMDRMIEYGLNVHFEDFPFNTTSKIPLNMTSSNVIGIKMGASEQIIIIGAHYDSISYGRGQDAPGADDNAAGVAVMLEIARVFQNESFNRTIYFIAFSGEEFGLLGSKNWLEKHEHLRDNIVAMINLDSVAYGDKLLIGSRYNWLLDVFPLGVNMERVSYLVGGDDISFLEENLPAVRFQDVGDPYHHTPDDTIETLNFSLAKKSAEIVATGINKLATTADLSPPEVSIEIDNGTVFYNTSVEREIQVFVDGMDLGYIESGKIHLPEGKHHVRVWVTDYIGNRAYDELVVNVNDTNYAVPSYEGVSVVTIPWKRSKEDIQAYGYQKYKQLTQHLNYEVNNGINNVTVIGFLDDIKIDNLSQNMVILTPGKHTFKIAAFNGNEIVGFDETVFLHEKTYNEPYPSIFYEEEPNRVIISLTTYFSKFKNSIFNLLDNLN